MSTDISWLRIARTKGVRSSVVKMAIDNYGDDPNYLMEKIIEHAQNSNRKIIPISHDILNQEIESNQKIGAELINISSEYYPSLLRLNNAPPVVITALGDKSILRSKNLAIVGSRKPLFHSQELARELAYEISKNNISITSGMAIGIDSCAHIGAIESGGKTIAVMGSGIDIIYPKENRELYKRISTSGLVITEYPFSTPPKPSNFPARNQIIAGISIATLVVEAYKGSEKGEQSGSLITANFAHKIGREVYVVPGFPTKDGRFGGNNYLIKEGIGKAIESAKDIIINLKKASLVANEINKKIQFNTSETPRREIEKAKVLILQNLSTIPMSIDEISLAIDLHTYIVRCALIELDLAKKITSDIGGKFYLIHT